MNIGFLDHHLNNYHANKFHGILTGPIGAEAGAVIVGAWESDADGDDWCAAKSVKRMGSAAEVVASSDALIIMAPDNPETHLALGAEALASGKPILFDKSLAADVADSREIHRLAAMHGTPVMAASSLRFSAELEDLVKSIGGRPVDGVFSRGFHDWRGYATHTLHPALRLLDEPVVRVIDTGAGPVRLVTLETAGGRRAFIDHRLSENEFEATPWQVGALVDGNYETRTVAEFDKFYENLIIEALRFFKTRESPVPAWQQIQQVAIELAAEESRAAGGVWVDVEV